MISFALVPVSTGQARTISQTEQSLVDVINETRISYGLHPLARDPRLDHWARYHSDQMIKQRRLAHTVQLGALPGQVIGENLAWCSSWLRVRMVVDAWLKSPEHRANLLRPGFRLIGVGVAIGPLDGVENSRVVTVDFSGT
jgi:uncharacterized protein YkwD